MDITKTKTQTLVFLAQNIVTHAPKKLTCAHHVSIIMFYIMVLVWPHVHQGHFKKMTSVACRATEHANLATDQVKQRVFRAGLAITYSKAVVLKNVPPDITQTFNGENA